MPHSEPHTDSPHGTREQLASVSVVVPSFNHAPYIGATLRSIFRQTHAPAELIVIDDGSLDDSVRVIEETLKSCPFPCELIARGNRGLCATLNEGLARSRGRYFAYLGSDDLWLEDFLRARIALLDARPRAVLAYGHCYLIDAQNHIVDCTRDWATYTDGDAREMLLGTIGPMSPTVLYRRDALARHGWREDARLEDYDLYLRLCTEGEFAFDARVLSAWRQHASNTSRNQMMMLDEHLRAQRRNAARLGLGEEELSRRHRAISFNRAEDFLRLGDKRAALSLLTRNLGGAASASQLARVLLRLLIPYSFIERRKRRLHARNAARYGSIQT